MPSSQQSDFTPDRIRDAKEIARRALALFAVVGLALGAPKDELVAWLKNEALWEELTPDELAYVSSPDPTKQQEVNASWRSEALTDLAKKLLNAHSKARGACLSGRTIPPHLDIGIIQERHHAINWVIGYENLAWDDVTTDT